MPFKLKDSGVTLLYNRKDTTENGALADVLELVFDGVGDTPENKYEVFVSRQDSLVRQWNFYSNRTDSVPRFTTPWDDYQPHGQLLLSGSRGKGQLTDIAVLDQVPEGVFSSFVAFHPDNKASAN